MLGINCIKYIFGYFYFSPNNFPKIQLNLGDQIEIRLSVYTYTNCRFSEIVIA